MPVTPDFYQATSKAFTAMWPTLSAMANQANGRPDTTGTIHAFALTAASRVGGLATGTEWGSTPTAVLDAAELCSIHHGQSVDAWLRVYQTAAEQIQTSTTEETR